MSLSFPDSAARRSRLAVAAALALGCTAGSAIAQDASSAPSLSARRIVIDSDTGRPRMPDHEDFAAVKQEAATQRAAAATARGAAPQQQPQFSSHPVLARMQGQPVPTKFGAVGRRVGVEKLSFSVVNRGENGRIETRCVAGEDAATHALHTHAAQESSHAQ